MLRTQTLIYANALNLIPELGPVRFDRLYAHFGDYQSAWFASETQYQQAGIDDKTIKQIIARKKLIDPAIEYNRMLGFGIDILLKTDKNYPEYLKEISSAPPVLYIRGNLKALDSLNIAVVGSRKMTTYGKQVCQELVSQLTDRGINIVSGLAFGVDAEALHTCLQRGGAPIAVLASALDDSSISPKSNFNLAQSIIKYGCMISEYGLNSNVQKQNFPIRNRIISGLSVGTLVIEADEDSGSLITAQYALEQNREVFAVPGSIFSPLSRGTNNLIKSGAKLVSHSDDIMKELNLDITVEMPETTFTGSETEILILENLSREPIHIDDLIKQIKLKPSEINSALTILEMKGRVKNMGGANYAKIR